MQNRTLCIRSELCAPQGQPDPGSTNHAELNAAMQVKFQQVSLKREKLEMSPVFATAFQHDHHTLGYIRLVNFSQHAAADMQKAIQRLQVRPPILLPLYGRHVISTCLDYPAVHNL